MNTKPITPRAHGILDYVISGALMAAPSLIGANSKAANAYRAISAGMTALNALTDTPAGIKRAIPFKGHQKADLGLLTGLSVLSFASFIRKDKRALRFHIGLLAVTAAYYILTDYKDKKSKRGRS
jgi:hypothetical protein